MAEMNHIEIMREDMVKPYRFASFPNAPKPREKDRDTHGKKLGEDLSGAMNCIESKRVECGLNSENMIVLEIIGDAISRDIIENMLAKFNVYMVEESQIMDTMNQNMSKILLQFADKSDILLFDAERNLWEKDDKQDAVLTYAQRRDLFNCIENIRTVSRDDRVGPRLKTLFAESKPLPEGNFIVNIDMWYNGDRSTIIETERVLKIALGTQGSQLMGDLFEIPSLLLGRALVNEYTLNALLDLDIVSVVDIPFSVVSNEPSEVYTFDINPIIDDSLDENAPLAAVIDSGVFSANPLLSNVIVGEVEFDTTENTTSDLNGHGTGVAGIIVYGDLPNCIKSNVFKPLVRICNGKVMHNENGNTSFPLDVRPEQLVKEAIEHFHQEYNCRIFNLSVGDRDNIYNGGRQFAWAEMLDQLSRNLDVVIVISAGNVSFPYINEAASRKELIEKSRDQLFHPEHRLIDPATSAIGVTVGSITRYDEPEVQPNRNVRLSAGERNFPSVFTRIGKGVNKAIKPDLVDYGGNYAFHQITRGDTRWFMHDRNLMEPTLNNNFQNIFRGYCGTSFSAPHVTHLAARLEKSIGSQLGATPSANLIRAFLVNSAKYEPRMIEWAEESLDPFYTGKSNPKQERKLRLLGYGKSDDSILFSNEKQVTLFAEDKLDLRSFHLYRLPVPKQFLEVRADKRISISLAHDPVTRLSRKEYLSCNLWFEVFRKIDEDTLLQYRAKKESDEDAEDYLDKLPNSYKASFVPGYKEILKSTLQQRVWEKGARGGADLQWEENEPYIYILVTGKERFKFAEQDLPQSYALVVTFSYSGQEDINLYMELKNNVRLRERQRERTRTQYRL